MSRLLTLGLVLLAVAVTLRSEVVGMVGLTLSAAGLLTRLWLRQIEGAIHVRRDAPAELPNGENAQVTVVIRNSALVRVPWLSIRESIALTLRTTVPPPTVITLGAGAEYRLSYVIRGARRGWYTLGPLQITLGDVLSLRRVRLTVPAAFVTVYPRIVPLSELGLPAMLSYGPLAGQLTEDPARPAGVREYAPGDDVRRLDWKSSARQRSLLVRRADPTIAPETTIALGFGREDYPAPVLQDALERAVTVAASFGVALLQRKLPVSLITNGYDPLNHSAGAMIGFGKGDGQRQTLLTLMGRLSVGADVDLFAQIQRQPLPWGGTLILVVADLTLDLLPQVVALRRRGQHVVLVLIEGSHAGLVLAEQQHLSAYTVGRRGQPVIARRI
jgi:uncharacterized protein (DUF58 family)